MYSEGSLTVLTWDVSVDNPKSTLRLKRIVYKLSGIEFNFLLENAIFFLEITIHVRYRSKLSFAAITNCILITIKRIKLRINETAMILFFAV